MLASLKVPSGGAPPPPPPLPLSRRGPDVGLPAVLPLRLPRVRDVRRRRPLLLRRRLARRADGGRRGAAGREEPDVPAGQGRARARPTNIGVRATNTIVDPLLEQLRHLVEIWVALPGCRKWVIAGAGV